MMVARTGRWLLGGVLLASLSATLLLFVLLPTNRAKMTFAELKLGMTYEDVQTLLGAADLSIKMKGSVDSPTEFRTNADPAVQQQENHQDYWLRQWASPDCLSVGIFDEEDRLVCRYVIEQHEAWTTRFFDLVKRVIQ